MNRLENVLGGGRSKGLKDEKKTLPHLNLSKSKRCAESITSRVLLSRHCPGISFARKQPPTAKRSYQDDSADLIRLDSDNKEGEHEGNVGGGHC